MYQIKVRFIKVVPTAVELLYSIREILNNYIQIYLHNNSEHLNVSELICRARTARIKNKIKNKQTFRSFINYGLIYILLTFQVILIKYRLYNLW